jgi:tryptophan synthase alpha chain
VSLRLADVTRRLESDGDKALVAFFTAGYPDERTFVEVAIAASSAGADVIEIGIPFSDPIADGPVIQASSEAALTGGMTVARALTLAAEIAGRVDTPLVAMGYLNPILNMGPEQFVAAAAGAGISGLILPDVPLEESADLRRITRSGGLSYVDLLAPTSDTDRVRRIAAAAGGGDAGDGGDTGFLYLVSVTGVTGSGNAGRADLEPFVARVRAETTLPLYVGFGVSTAEQARETARLADGVIIGSQLIRLASEGPAAGAAARIGEFLSGVKEAISKV